MAVFAAILLAALSSSDAIVTLLNSPNSTSPTRYAAAQSLVRREADDGKPLQQFVFGLTASDRSLRRKYCDLSRDKIRFLAEKKDNSLAWYLLSVESNNVDYLRRAADGGNVQALNAYGTMLIQTAFAKNAASNTLEKALARGYDCFRRAAAQKDPNAYINLGTCYLRGFGCDINLALAHQCFRSAAEAGHPEGMDYVSANFELGHGVERNPALALAWRMKAKAVRGDKAAAEWLRDGKRDEKK